MEDHRVLARIIKDYPDALEDRKKLQALFSDFFPEDRRKRNTLLLVYDDGIVDELRAVSRFDHVLCNRLVKTVSQDYGIQAEHAREAVLAWAQALGLAVAESPSGETSGGAEAEDGAHGAELSGAEENGQRAYEYVETPRGLKLTRYIDFDAEVVTVPGQIGGRNVAEIGNHAFKGCVGIGKIIISEGIETLGNGVFLNCKELKEAVLPPTLRRIGTSDPAGCPKILGTMTKLDGAFEYTALEEIHIPDSVRYLGEYAFSGCGSLQKAVLPEGLQEIGAYAFSWCRALREVVFPAGLQVIRKSAFEGCESLEEAVLPEGVTGIEQGAFAGCRNLRRIYLPDSVIEIGGGRGSGFAQAFGEPADRHADFTILCNAGSYAMIYARSQQIKCAKANI